MTADEMKAMAAEMAKAMSEQGMTHQAAPEPEAPREKMRAAAQGLSFGSADEIEAFFRSKLGDDDYQAALEEIRGKLKQYRSDHTVEALSTEALGALLPAVLGAVVTGGTSTATAAGPLARLTRLLATGAGEGAVYGHNAGEGGVTEGGNLGDRVVDTGKGALYGAGGAGIGAGAANAVGYGLRGLSDYARRTLGPRASKAVEGEIQKAAQDAGISVDEAVEAVMSGRLLADNRTIADVARGWRAQSAEAGRVLSDVYETRPGNLRAETMDYLKRNMAGEGDPNVLRAQQAKTDAAKAAQSAEYNRVFDAMPVAPAEVQGALSDALVRRPQAGKDAQELYRAKTGKNPFFRVADEVAPAEGAQGPTIPQRAVFDRAPSLREAEIIRRGVRDNAEAASRTGSGAVAGAVKDIDTNLKGVLDAASPELGAVRAKWAQIESGGDAFDAGRKALGKSADEVEIEFDALRQKSEELANAYRSGLYTAYKSRAATGSGKSLPTNIVSDERKEGQIMRLVFPEDQLDGLLARATNASDAQNTANKVIGGSDTAITRGRIGEQATGAAADALSVAGGDIQAGMRLVTQAFKGMNPGMTPKEAAEAARLVVESNPEVVRRALTDDGAMNQIHKLVEGVTRGAGKVGRTEGAAVGGLLSSF